MGLFSNAKVTSEYRTVWGTVTIQFPAGMTEANRKDTLDEIAAWERAPKHQVLPDDVDYYKEPKP
jgi:hypothetical protein